MQEQEWDKVDIIHFLSNVHGYKSYLEICTPTTGSMFWKIRHNEFETCHRLMYRCAADYGDTLRIDFRAPGLDTGEIVAGMRTRGQRYDVILVDSFHLYDTSYRDLTDALSLLSDHGTMVVHDCMPDNEACVASEFKPGAWCGVSFIAYIDFVHAVTGISHATVETDMGCGIVRRVSAGQESARLPEAWRTVRSDAVGAYRYMKEHAPTLLNLVSVEDFRGAELERAGQGPTSGGA